MLVDPSTASPPLENIKIFLSRTSLGLLSNKAIATMRRAMDDVRLVVYEDVAEKALTMGDFPKNSLNIQSIQ